MLQELRKLVAPVHEQLGLGDAVLRRILNHTAPKMDVLQRHYVGLNVGDVREGLVKIQLELAPLMERECPGVSRSLNVAFSAFDCQKLLPD
jgi:hypothetical protein